ncbi:2-C-methyl-D-erythritol 2,4-cyclodiphosphate synthase [Thermoanaerobacterium thermosaccharolyticum]|uniref:2-C-methyl-D-erythritol 2,4-cyclodiphosphate synthase n=1 Tax=Thermoanaerobacterium thermosaccharolyticum TaxID=1517 RepID=UPI0017853275|nr:2-C-methyl-D-erythritol 2,4-cyclodiphosphate synthase [Thermoanaerobacterium thermosaccharolyticum]MBE0069456.1 2-C-methyl-D-erythritol 2,4-cyclodiphosphate synthase [Thermoanaerobacterium thermosaccharolyticum]MBE0229136.1 2-C-methyl-D-erythritol 2,4-cyclodiphosphate synthase [Thermoanaerobacterium thermosaccharolyticum]MCP2240186.1 2-C-methyl-D-erythritol 2,4-cyclodiphosphate synthase [Thermoanaerobacterium thermosaccharolyticum]
MRVGIGYDVHKLEAGRKLILGGVQIPYEKGLLGHSDADVLIHAVIDGILGAAGLGDIGTHFPDSEWIYKDIDSTVLLKKTMDLIKGKFAINNIDCIVVAQEPKLSPYKDAIGRNLSKVLNIGIDRVNIKAKTEEGLGFTGRKEGISAYAIVSLIEKCIDS